MSNDKEINETSEKKLQKVSKQKKQGRESDQVIKSDQKNGPNRSNDGKKRKFCRSIHKPRKCHYMRVNSMVVVEKPNGK